MRKKIDISKYKDKKYDLCALCGVTPRTVDRWMIDGMPEQYYIMMVTNEKTKSGKGKVK